MYRRNATLYCFRNNESGNRTHFQKLLRNAKEITIGRKNESTNNVKHVVYTVQAKDKYEALKRIVDYYPQIYGIIFCRTRKETQEIADKLMQEGYNADSLHGELSQAQRVLLCRNSASATCNCSWQLTWLPRT